MKRFLVFFLVLMLVVLGLSWQQLLGPKPTTDDLLPWRIELLAEGRSRVFDVVLDKTPLMDVIARWGHQPQLAIFQEPSGRRSLEAYFGRLRMGALEAHIITVLAADPATLERMANAAVSEQAVPSGARKLELREADRQQAFKLAVREINFIPLAAMQAATLKQHFGPPATTLPAGEQRVYWLYPEKGLVILRDTASNKVALHFIAPRAFGGLRARLHKAVTTQPTEQP